MINDYTKDQLVAILMDRLTPSKLDLLIYRALSSFDSGVDAYGFAIHCLKTQYLESSYKEFIILLKSAECSSLAKQRIVRALGQFENDEVISCLSYLSTNEDYDLRRAALYSLLKLVKNNSNSEHDLNVLLSILSDFVSNGELDGLDYLIIARNIVHIQVDQGNEILLGFPQFSGEELGIEELAKIFDSRGLRLKVTKN